MTGPVTVPSVASRKRARGDEPIVMVTAYDEPFARFADEAGVDLILVGDSVADNVLGYENTLQVEVAQIAHHVGAVARARTRALVVADLPWMSYHLDPLDAVRNAATLIRAGAKAVKLEGGRRRLPVIHALLDAEIPVMGHLGLTPQSVLVFGGFRIQGRAPKPRSRSSSMRRPSTRQACSRSSSRACPTASPSGSPNQSRSRRSVSAPARVPTVRCS